MKILCIADQIDPLVYNSSIKTRYHDVDMVLAAGDLPLEYLDFVVSSLNCPLLFVYGNHNLEKYEAYRKGIFSSEDICSGCGGITHIGSLVRREKGLIIAGLGGSRQYNGGPNQYTEGQMRWEIWKLFPRLLFNRIFRGRWVDILLTHAAPWGIHDKKDLCHQGFKSFLWFMRVFKPRYLIHGHIHLYDLSELRTTSYGATLVVNAYSQYLLNTEFLWNNKTS
jgi:Icc-related predicted phosphoesterase